VEAAGIDFRTLVATLSDGPGGSRNARYPEGTPNQAFRAAPREERATNIY
jgi:hypothetical protein